METEVKLANRTLKYLSPTGISRYRNDPESFYLRYLSTISPGEEEQTQAMAIGSAFDAYAKSYIHEKLFGKGNDPKYEFNALFEAQVSSKWRDWAILHGMYVFDKYQRSGALADLVLELQQAVNVPKFEIEIMGVIHGRREPATMVRGGVIFLGKPDVFFINKFGAHVIIDWKVNGYLSNQPISPMPGYVMLRQDVRKTGHHKECVIMLHNGVRINRMMKLEEKNEQWAIQLSIYSWLAGCEVGEQFIAGIDQICCSPNGSEFPDIRIAEHRVLVSEKFQHEIFRLSQDIWERSHSDHFFTELPIEDSKARCKLLDEQSILIASETDELFLEMTSSVKKWGK